MRKIKDGKQYLYEFELEFRHATTKAICVTDGTADYWIPLSQLENDFDGAEVGELIEIVIPEWLAQEKELI